MRLLFTVYINNERYYGKEARPPAQPDLRRTSSPAYWVEPGQDGDVQMSVRQGLPLRRGGTYDSVRPDVPAVSEAYYTL